MSFEHGASGYNNHKCRCEVCTAGTRETHRQYRARRRTALVNGCAVEEHIKHGASTYSNHGCRCDVCRTAWAQRARQRRREAS